MTGSDRKLIVLLNNTTPRDLVNAIYGSDADADYLDEKAWQVHKDAVRWMSSLDSVNLDRLAKIATESK